MANFGRSFMDNFYKGAQITQTEIDRQARQSELEKELAMRMSQLTENKRQHDEEISQRKSEFEWTKEYQKGLLNVKETPKPEKKFLGTKYDPNTHSYFDLMGYTGPDGKDVVLDRQPAGQKYEPKDGNGADGGNNSKGIDDGTATLIGKLSNPSTFASGMFGMSEPKDPNLVKQEVTQDYTNLKTRLIKNPRAFQYINNIEKAWGRTLSPKELNDEITKHYQSGNLDSDAAKDIIKFLPVYEKIYNGIK